MKYEAQEASINYNVNEDIEAEHIENVYKDSHTLIEDDEISDAEEGFMRGYAEA